ncbi:MAG TPA: aryl-sulfate sulfotransferase, partial [Polyangiaceae bacterium]
GNVVHRWAVSGFPPIMKAGGSLAGCVAYVPGTSECLQMQEVSWLGEPHWSFGDWSGAGIPVVAARQHHDFQLQGDPVGYYAPGQIVAERGSTLVLAYGRSMRPEIRDVEIDDDVIYELDGFGNMTNVIWYGADHVDEFGFSEEARAHLRTIAPGAVIDWLHGNALSVLGPNRWFDEGRVEFDPKNIMYSSRHANFVAILSRETGAVVWRVGPDFAGRPEEGLGQFVGQHNPHLIPKGLPGAGNVLVFDNGGVSGYGEVLNTGSVYRHSRDYSRVVEFDPVTLRIVWEYGGEFAPERFFSYFVGGAQRLPNGNTLITMGMDGRVVEVTPERQVVWEYRHEPIAEASVRWLYRAYRVPPEWLPAGVNAAYGNYASWKELFEAR